ncbi:hypothetical protein FQA39_LY12405 [Lamprigera yunnana]|nr:hypothetical protein FQA39_LY12405 [Lamprigera yunnana]
MPTQKPSTSDKSFLHRARGKLWKWILNLSNPQIFIKFASELFEKRVIGGEVATVKTRGVYKLLESSTKRRNSTDEQFLKGLLSGSSQVQVHVTRYLSKVVQQRENDSGVFYVRQWSLKNTESYIVGYHATQRNEMVKVTLPKMAGTILEMTKNWEDDWGRKVKDGLDTDLVAVNAEYHRNCLPKFYAPVRKAGQKRGRPSDPNAWM